MTLAYFDCFCGAAGDMIVAALLDAGADVGALETELRKLPGLAFEIHTEAVRRSGLAGRTFRVEPGHEHAHRRLGDILGMIGEAGLSAKTTDRATRIFERLAEAEARVHKSDPADVTFHEVGATDSIVDIVGGCIALELLGVESIFCSAIPLGSGTVQCAHGELPVPSPATMELLLGVPTARSPNPGEATTPTAAAFLTTVADDCGTMPEMCVSAVGYGAGTRDTGPLPSLLRVILGTPSDDGTDDAVVELSANIDDATGEVLGATIDALLEAGCLDAWVTPAYMKKSRPAWTLSVLCRPGDVGRAEGIVFAETTTFGIRRTPCLRTKLQRAFETVETVYGSIRVKVGRRSGHVVTVSPEFSDCLGAAQRHGVPSRDVLQAARVAFGSDPSP